MVVETWICGFDCCSYLFFSQDWIRVLKFWQDPKDFTPALTRQKNFWEGSPDEGGDSVATTVVIHTVIEKRSPFGK
ncbi:MAG: hypothetical protein V7L20_11635 [Nostoc sp.]|uniref:hypothetical protein n=1 Tax=Nostoc sp. TaxID=1180 RepID=UPI002FF576A8